ncbi:RagB/SusD family nutrient uptake outer membrane protein [Galbibacter sp. EGI 63066]|uniref:RagB/SusD family nutrient uptake outer membrane protein n=1 Tax=Galbibacter sp. EGI 63066 TaxID=2993559 RepID=UPI0022498011|nr:RagB/SusD family nutrient uptake outer membrane protein [Galbibacter sp. EGI 63066]MCX2680745.1 RagB/SusD family nutrient uptake outer membrane protein [Galbibacter sp. EGI 63066]
MDSTYKLFQKHITKAIFLMALVLISCENYLEIEPPTNQLTGTVVFEDVATVNAAFAHIYSEMRETAFTNGAITGLSYLMGHYTDELELYANFPGVQTYSNNNVLPSDSSIKQLWDTGYSIIYATNSILEGVQASTSLSEEEKNRFLGEAYFLRGFIHFHLVNIFGDIPFIDSTDYRTNSEVSRLNEEQVYQRLVEDLLNAKELLPTTDDSLANLRPNHWTASALLGRVYLYRQEWQLALNESLHVISNGGYVLNTDLGQVFLKGSPETIWQLDTGIPGTNTHEAHTFVIAAGPPSNSALSEHLLNGFETGDARFDEWVGTVSDGSDTWFFPYKYKLNTPTGTTEECSILFRLTELYLTAAEAQAQLGNLPEASGYLNATRNRAQLPPITSMEQDALLEAIYKERRIEFFTEQGHRFFDLKRTGRATTVLSPIKPNWESTDVRLPIPEVELALNPNLLPQNEGY